jgi:protein PhnA
MANPCGPHPLHNTILGDGPSRDFALAFGWYLCFSLSREQPGSHQGTFLPMHQAHAGLTQMHDSRFPIPSRRGKPLMLVTVDQIQDIDMNDLNELPHCPECNSAYTYENGIMFVCPECGYEWVKEPVGESADGERIIKDANGNPLQDGDTVTVIKSLKVKGSSLVVKVGTKVKNIRLVDGDHDIDCKIDGIGAMKLKSEFVKKA